MSQTPLPHTMSALTSADAPDEAATTGEFRARKRVSSLSNRPVSAFAPGQSARGSEPPAAPGATVGPASEDVDFAAALRAAGVALELEDEELARSAQDVRSEQRVARRIDLLNAYYNASHDPLAAKRRQATDRWFLFQAADSLDAAQLLSRLLDVVPELSDARLERVGGSDGPLVLRAGDDVCALDDERPDEPGVSSLSVCDLVRGINVLLERRSVRARLVGLIGDGSREAYLALPSVSAAIALSSADYLAAVDAESLLDLTGW